MAPPVAGAGVLPRASSAASFQRARTQAPSWQDASGALVRGGALQLQKHGAPFWKCLPEPPGRLLGCRGPATSPRTTPETVHRTEVYAPVGFERARKKPQALRDRVAKTAQLSDSLKGELLERLDRITAEAQPARRPSWTDEMTRPGRGRRKERDRGGRAESSGSSEGSYEKSDGVARAYGSQECPSHDHGDDCIPGHGVSPDGRLVSPSGDVWSAFYGAGSRSTALLSPPTSPLMTNQQGGGDAQAAPRPAEMAWKCHLKASTLPKKEKLQQKVPALTSASSSPLLPPPSAPRAPVAEVRRAVAHARDALRAPAGFTSQLPGEDSEEPVRGSGSLLRTSLRYALQS